MYYSDEGSSSGSGSDVEGICTSFPTHMLSPKEQKVDDNKYPPSFFSKSDADPPFPEFKRLTHSTSQEQYSDMESEEEDHDLTVFYSDMDENEESDEFDASVNYSEMFPVEEYEQRNNQVVMMNTRLEKDMVDLVGGRNQDYLGLARDYKMQRKFSDPQKHPSCVLCHKDSAKDTFFPCEHRCVCASCIKSENFCDERDMPYRKNGYNICPLCASVIKCMIPFDHGREVEKYWEWVEEVAPPLPPGFYRKFNRSAEVLHKVYIDKVEHDIIEESLCKQN